MRRLPLILFACLLLRAELVDRLAVTVGSAVITELDIDEDLRVAALLNGQPISRDLEARRAAADRMVEQFLIRHEIDLSHYPPPSEQEVDTFYSHVRETLGGEDALKALLTGYKISARTLRDHLKAQLATLRFIEIRFAPDVNISDADLESAYNRKVAALRTATPGISVPPFDAAEQAKISKELLAERTDAALNSWLAEGRKQINITYVDSELR